MEVTTRTTWLPIRCYRITTSREVSLDFYLRNIVDLPFRPGFNICLDGGDCLHGGHYTGDLGAN